MWEGNRGSWGPINRRDAKTQSMKIENPFPNVKPMKEREPCAFATLCVHELAQHVNDATEKKEAAPA